MRIPGIDPSLAPHQAQSERDDDPQAAFPALQEVPPSFSLWFSRLSFSPFFPIVSFVFFFMPPSLFSPRSRRRLHDNQGPASLPRVLLTRGRGVDFKRHAGRRKERRDKEGWEDGTPPPHRDFKERCVVRYPSPTLGSRQSVLALACGFSFLSLLPTCASASARQTRAQCRALGALGVQSATSHPGPGS